MIGTLTRTILSLALMMLLGVLLVKCKILKSADSRVLSTLSLYLILPCVILSSFQIDFTDEVKSGLLLAFAAAIVIHIGLMLVNIPLRTALHLDCIEQTSILYSSASNLTVPIVTVLLGREWIIYSSAFLCVQMVQFWTHGKSIICGEKGIDLRRILSNVNIIASLIGIVLFTTGIRLPSLVADTMASIGNMIGPVAMLIAGMLVAGSNIRQLLCNGRLWLVAVLRLVIVPSLVLLFLKYSGLADIVPNGSEILLITFLASIAPSASVVTQCAQVYGQDADYASSINVLTTLMCIITMPVMVALYQL